MPAMGILSSERITAAFRERGLRATARDSSSDAPACRAPEELQEIADRLLERA